MKDSSLERYISFTESLLVENVNTYKNFIKDYKASLRNEKLKALNNEYANLVTELSKYFAKRLNGDFVDPVVSKRDKRFMHPGWEKSPVLDFIKQFYFLTSDWMERVVSISDSSVEEKGSSKKQFFVKQLLDAISPSNSPFLNPEVIQEFINTKGMSVVNGYINFLKDMNKNGGFSLSTADMDHFKIGHNIGMTPGKVIFQNDLIQLIQYEPNTAKVFEIPILIISPWINKFYIMDLSPENSFVKWLVDLGYTVFIISWVNPNKDHEKKSFESYLKEGLLDSLNKIHEVTKAVEANIIGYCLGGTLLSSGIAYLNNPECNEKPKCGIKSATLIATLTDFKKVGDFGVFINDKYIKNMENITNKYGYLPAKVMFNTFNMMKANDMIWSNILRNYLLGKEPLQMEMLYWNADCTNMAKAAYMFLLKNLYQKNLLAKKNGIKLLGVNIDLGTIKTPVFMLSAEKDHIAPWRSTYEATKIFKGPIKFVLGGSGHVAGVVNPVKSKKYNYWINSTLPSSAEEWKKTATMLNGSWWKEWKKWIKKYSGKQVAARTINTWLEDAPGSFVRNFIPKVVKKTSASSKSKTTSHKKNNDKL